MKNLFDDISHRLKSEFSGAGNWISNIADILIVAFLLYALFIFLKKHNSARFIKFLIILLVVAALLSAQSLGLSMLSKISFGLVIAGVVCFTLLFPQEIRRTLFRLSSPKDAAEVFNTEYNCSDDELKDAIDGIVRAVQNMAKKDVGALIVIAPQPVPFNILESGTKMDAILSSALLESIFNTKAPLHDGAVFIRGNRIVAAGCFLSLTENTELDKELGTRHRAAIGVSETNNVLAIIVSEETGIISIAYGGEIHRYFDSVMLHEKLEQVYGLRAVENTRGKKLRRRKRA